MTDIAYSTPMPDRPAEKRVSDRSAVLAPWLLLTQRFGDVTAYTRSPAEGRWRGDRTHIEDVVVFEVLCRELDRHWWNAYQQRLENDFRQQSVVIRAEPALLF